MDPQSVSLCVLRLLSSDVGSPHPSHSGEIGAISNGMEKMSVRQAAGVK